MHSVLLCSAILYLNDDFEGGDFIFTESDAKTVSVRFLNISHYFLLVTK